MDDSMHVTITLILLLICSTVSGEERLTQPDVTMELQTEDMNTDPQTISISSVEGLTQTDFSVDLTTEDMNTDQQTIAPSKVTTSKILEQKQSDTDNLRCFSCHDTGNNRNCWDEDYLKSAAVKNGTYVRKCQPQQGYCLIEQFIQNGKVTSLIRDCNNDKDFSVQKDGRLKSLKPYNQTICTFTGGSLVCISLCQTDYCNGPLGSNPNSAVFNMNNVITVGLLLVLKFVCE